MLRGTGWARHLFSGTGELLGIVVGLGDGPMVPSGIHATRVESICRLATLAIEQRNLLDDLAFKADHDALTKLLNRSSYERVLAHTLRQENDNRKSTALLYINLDRFRLVNDVLGIEVGNRLLAQVGRRFQANLREGDILARVGGDEFAVLLPDRPGMEHAAAVAGRLLRSLSTPFSIDDHELFLSASIGIGYSTAASTKQSLEREAYVALYQAKQAGKAQSMSYRASMAATPPERLEMEKRLRFALARREVRLHYQPQMELASGTVRGAEALLRWRPEGLGLVSPAAFIPILEETGLIADFGRWVLAEACRQGKEWIDQAGMRLRIGVNVSALQFARADFVQDVEQALSDTSFPPELLELELTESLFIGDFAATHRIFRNLQAAGIRFALDDFGEGQSSLSYLHELPFHRLKIDQSFIRRIEDGERSPMVENILRMADSLGLSTIAEGVETVHQAGVLRSLGCDEGQGYLFAPAMPPVEFTSYYRNHSPARVGLPDAKPLLAMSAL
jgi:diguanylate cyclase (GGDEF)-like protein